MRWAGQEAGGPAFYYIEREDAQLRPGDGVLMAYAMRSGLTRRVCPERTVAERIYKPAWRAKSCTQRRINYVFVNNRGSNCGECVYFRPDTMPLQTPDNAPAFRDNEHRPGAVPGPPAQPRISRPGALGTPVQAGLAPTAPPGRRPAGEVISTAVDPPAVGLRAPAHNPALEARPQLRPPGARVIAAPWLERAQPEFLPAPGEEPSAPAPEPVRRAPTPGMERTSPREAGIRLNQMEEAPWPWTAPASATPPVGPADPATPDFDIGSAPRYATPRRGGRFLEWSIFLLAWAGFIWLIVQRDEPGNTPAGESTGQPAGQFQPALQESHIGVDEPREVHLK